MDVGDAPVLAQLTYLHRLGLVDASALLAEAATCHGDDEDPKKIHLFAACAGDRALVEVRPVTSMRILEEATWGIPWGMRRAMPYVCGTCENQLSFHEQTSWDLDLAAILGPFADLGRHVSWSLRADRVLAHRYPTKRDAVATHVGAARFLTADQLPAPTPAGEPEPPATALAAQIAAQRDRLAGYRPGWRLRVEDRRHNRHRSHFPRPRAGDTAVVWVTLAASVFPVESMYGAGWSIYFGGELALAGSCLEGPYPVSTGGLDRWLLRVTADQADAAWACPIVTARADATAAQVEATLLLDTPEPGKYTSREFDQLLDAVAAAQL